MSFPELGILLFMVVMLILGVSCLWIPEKVQVLATRWVESGITRKWRILTGFVRSKQYLVNLRIVGSGLLLFSAVALWVLAKSC